jgi:hypothetical protein
MEATTVGGASARELLRDGARVGGAPSYSEATTARAHPLRDIERASPQWPRL